MGGMDDNVPLIGDWLPPNPSPGTLFSDFIAKEYSSRLISADSLQSTHGGSLPESREPGVVNGKNQDCMPEIQVSKELFIELESFNVPKSSTRGGLSERIAGRAGFGNLTLDTCQIRKKTSFSSPTRDVRSPLVTIPPGLSPATLLDSPIFVSNSLTEASPTTGKIAFMECDNVTDAITSKNTYHTTEDFDPPSFSFKLHPAYFSSVEMKPELPIHPQQPNLQDGYSQLSDEKDSGETLLVERTLNSNINREHSPSFDDPQIGDTDPKGEYTSASLGAPAEDGYNWRKYGQKQVKGSEYPRSYYKCTHPNCQVKKKVERSHEGHITEIIYKGLHNHLKSSANRRSSIPSCYPGNDILIDGLQQNGWKQNDLDANPYVSIPIELCEQPNPVQSHDGPYREASDGMDASSLLSNDDDDNERVTHGSASLTGDGDGDETESKRRKLDACALEMSVASRAIREPRVVVQTTSEVDILDDGYRWRKYGQKVVKGNPNPRSYYKCTNPGCPVRKHVERASHDLKSVITTYEGKHNHDVPAARISSQASSSAASIITTTASPPSCLVQRKTEPARMQDSLGRFDSSAALGSFVLPSRWQHHLVGPAIPNFSPNFSMAGLGNMPPLKMPAFPPFPPYISQLRPGGGGVGFMIPKVVPKEEPDAAVSGPPVSGGSSRGCPWDLSCRY